MKRPAAAVRDDRREFQRLKLSKPILATMRGANALILDIGVAGAFLEHYGTAEHGERFNLVFRWQAEDVEFHCEVARSLIIREPGGDGKSLVSHTGVRFVEAVGDANARLQDLIATFVGHILAAQKANAAGERGDSAGASVLARLGEARRKRSRGYIAHHLKDGNWWHAPTSSPKQPPDGFTTGTHEDEDEVESLCRTYADGDQEARDLIRLVAELSLLQEG
ncbi:MAG TPA: hypothetical protein VEK57_27695 [Thermoanaerobaculia bacterium]|nr:hypothetical protein [Thermoanaerobaculia bacterium]